jgi:hypothetical protein
MIFRLKIWSGTKFPLKVDEYKPAANEKIRQEAKNQPNHAVFSLSAVSIDRISDSGATFAKSIGTMTLPVFERTILRRASTYR